MIIILILASLIVLNFLLLIFSCNKTSKKEVVDLKSIKGSTGVAKQLETHQLAPTGS